MISIRKIFAVSLVALCTACAGTPVSMGSRGSVPAGSVRTLTADACGFQLLLLIPIAINGRAERAYRRLEREAGGDFITDVQVQERWTWGFVGTSYCTSISAKAIHGIVTGGTPPSQPAAAPAAIHESAAAPATIPEPAAAQATTPAMPPAAGPAQAPDADGIRLIAPAALKAQPRSTSQTLGTVPAGTDVRATHRMPNQEGDWLFVEYGGMSGWIAAPSRP